MAGLMGYLAAGALGGAGKGLSENAKSEMAFNYEQMNAQIKAEMEQRMYERGRKDKKIDYGVEQADKIAAEERAYGRQKGLLAIQKDSSAGKLDALKLKLAEEEVKMPYAIKLEFESNGKLIENKQSTLDKAVAEGTITPEGRKELVDSIETLTMRNIQLLTPFQGDLGKRGKEGAFDPAGYTKGGAPVAKPSEAPAATTPPAQQAAVPLTIAQARTKARELIRAMDDRDQISIANTRKALDALPQEYIGGLRKEAGI